LQKLFEPIVLAQKPKTKEAWTGKCSTTISSLQGGAEQNHQEKGVARFILNKLCLSFVKSNLKMKTHSNDSFGMINTNLAPLQEICHLEKCICNVVESHGNHVHRFFVGSKFLSLQGNHLLMPARNSHAKKEKRCSKLHSKMGN